MKGCRQKHRDPTTYSLENHCNLKSPCEYTSIAILWTNYYDFKCQNEEGDLNELVIDSKGLVINIFFLVKRSFYFDRFSILL